jgi:hypothetical protein
MEHVDDGTFKLRSTRPIDGVRGEGLPDDVLTDVGSDEERNTRAQAITLLKHLIQTNDNNAGEEQLQPQPMCKKNIRTSFQPLETCLAFS